MAYPRLTATGHPRVHRHRAPPRVVGCFDRQLDVDRPAVRNHERGVERQLLQHTAGLHHHVHEGASRDCHRPQHDMVGKPRMRGDRQSTGVQEPARGREFHDTVQQRMAIALALRPIG